jgi:predicted nucleic acid-binding protein
MSAEAPATIDTNILIYAVDRTAAAKHRIALGLVEQTARGHGLLTLQVLGEFFYATTRKGVLSHRQAAAYVTDWRTVFPIVAADEAALVGAIDAVSQHGFSFWDAMLLATARQAGCDRILSEDMQHGRSLEGVEIVNPFTT